MDSDWWFAQLDKAEGDLPQLLDDVAGWNSLDVNYFPPRVERLWRPYGQNMRLFLHCLHPCTRDEALLHPHKWASIARVWGPADYFMIMGSSPDLEPPSAIISESLVRVVPGAHYSYAMLHPDGWHAVMPRGGVVYSMMLIDRPWNRPIPQVTANVLGKLPSLTRQRELELLNIFRGYCQ